MRQKRILPLAAGVLLAGAGLTGGFFSLECGGRAAAQAEVLADGLGTEIPAEDAVLLRWPEDLGAVRYELELFDEKPGELPADAPAAGHAYDNVYVFSNGFMLDLRQDAPAAVGHPLYWRVRSIDLDGHPISHFSEPARYKGEAQPLRNAPLPRTALGGEKGGTLLYPVYAYIGNPGAVKYEIEVTDAEPEDPDSILPSQHRVYAGTTELSDFYDPEPRIGAYWWRVRGMDADGNPVGVWSQAQPFHTLTEDHWDVGIYGDSFSHGGGHLSFGPADFEYSYAHYMDVPSINLSQSGDTSEMMVERFERDVLPFSPRFLLIMGGVNSLRAGVPPEDVIRDLETLQEKCRTHGITPILLTIPPINPANIDKAFHEETYEGWKASIDAVNAFIRTQPHIDTAAPFAGMEEMPTELALDGLHGDWNAKEMIARVINQELPKFMK